MTKNLFGISKKVNKNGFVTGIAFIILVILHIPFAIKYAAHVACIAQVSHDVWVNEKNHSKANIIANEKCN